MFNSETRALRWQPRPDQLGEHQVRVRLIDAYGGQSIQEYSLRVTGINAPPAIVSVPVTSAGQDQLYRYSVVATDPENDALTYQLGRRPEGMTIDEQGQIQWQPSAEQLGPHTVDVTVFDALGATTTQTFTLAVTEAVINQALSITSQPVFLAGAGSVYQYQIEATDPEAQTLTYELIEGPDGLTVDTATGLVEWLNPVAGSYSVVVGAVDAGGLGAGQGYTLTSRGVPDPENPGEVIGANQAPEIRSTATTEATPGQFYRYDVRAIDADGDALTYALDAVSVEKGIEMGRLGRLVWNPTSACCTARSYC